MSARLSSIPHPDSAHGRTAPVIARIILKIGVTEAARLIGVDHGTISRRVNHRAEWPYSDLLTLKRLERDLFGTRTIHDAEAAALFGEGVADAMTAEHEVTATIGLHGEIIALSARILADGVVNNNDREAAVELRDKVAASHIADDSAMASLFAKLGK